MHTQNEENSQKNNATKKKKKKKFKKMLCIVFGTFLSETNPTLQPSRVVVELEEEGTICCHVRHTK
jgi:hypothetical protein